jgi:membrane associated rhomboid family serine protease
VATRDPFGRRPQLSFGGGFGRPPRDLIALLAVVFLTFSLQFFASTAIVPALLRLTPAVWRSGWLWQLVTYPFAGYGPPSIWFLLELLMLYWFGRDVRYGLGRRRFWRLLVTAALAAALVAVAVQLLAGGLSADELGFAPFVLMQGQRVLLAMLIAAFATMNRDATVLFMFVLPVRAFWFLPIEILIAFIAFLGTHDLAGFLGVTAAVGFVYLSLTRRGARRGLRDLRLRAERWWIERKLARLKRKRGLRVVQGDKRGGVKKGPWTN